MVAEGEKDESFISITPGAVHEAVAAKDSGDAKEGERDTREHTEECLIFTPKVTMRGRADISSESLAFDHTFGPESDAHALYVPVSVTLSTCLSLSVFVSSRLTHSHPLPKNT